MTSFNDSGHAANDLMRAVPHHAAVPQINDGLCNLPQIDSGFAAYSNCRSLQLLLVNNI
jgi:hypothetical protein